MIKLKLYCNIQQEFQRAIECADYLKEIACLEDDEKGLVQYLPCFSDEQSNVGLGVTNHTVIKNLCENPNKRAFLLL